MRRVPSLVRPVLLASTLLLGTAVAAGAQADTTRLPVRKQQPEPRPAPRIPVTKSVPTLPDTTTTVVTGEVAPRLDSVAAPVATQPVAQPLLPAPAARRSPYLFGGTGFYLGVAGGATLPVGSFNDMGYRSGAHVSVPIGWQPRGRAFGLRALLAFDQPRSKASNPWGADPKVFAASLDAVAKLPLRRGGGDVGPSLYAVGGGGAYQFRAFGGSGPVADALGDDTGKAHVTKWGVDLGGGLEWGFGPGALFAESRWVNVHTNGTGTRAGQSTL